MRRLRIECLVGDRSALAIGAALACVATMGLAGTALAAPSTIPKTFTGIKVVAAPGTVNNMTIDYKVADLLDGGFVRDAHFITDSAGLIVTMSEGQLCSQPVGNTSICYDSGTGAGVPAGSTGTGEAPIVLLGNLNDTFASDNVGDLDVDGGPGNDTMKGGSRPITIGAFMDEPGEILQSNENFDGGPGNDVLRGFGQPDGLIGGSGNDKIDGGSGKDYLIGGPGNDKINARDGQRDKRIDCGPGKDRARVDKIDPKPISC